MGQIKLVVTKEKPNDLICHGMNDDIIEKHEVIPPGMYTPDQIGGLFSKTLMFSRIVPKETLHQFTSGIIADILAKADSFLSENTITKYKAMDVAHKLCMIMYGPHGTGKTSTANVIMQMMSSKHKAICVDMTGKNLRFVREVLGYIRSIQSNPIVLFIDEIDSSIDCEENEYLTFLDGNDSFTNTIIIGCTNKIGKIPDRIKNRKSRVKYTFEVRSFPIEVYSQYIKAKLPDISEKDLAKLAFLSEESGLSIDTLKHVIVDHVIDDISFEEAIANAKKYPVEA